MLFPGGLSRALTLSYDDGVDQDERLLEIPGRRLRCIPPRIPTWNASRPA